MINRTALAFMLGALSTCAMAQTPSSSHTGYSQDGSGSVMRSEYGLCWRSGSWTPADARAGCDGALKPPIANPIAPEINSTLESASPPVAAARCDFSVTLESDQTFTFGKAEPSPAARRRIAHDVLPHLEKCHLIESIAVTGHSDRIGSTETNRTLSEKRAASIARLLEQHGVTAAISVIGAGNSAPLTSCNTGLKRKQLLDCLAPDRRVEVVVRGSKR